VRGRFLASPGDQPLQGALIHLVGRDGAEVASTLSNASGWFSLTAPTAGGFTVRAEHIGYATRERTVQVAAGSVTWVELRADFRAIELEGLTASVDKACDLPAETARRLAALWDEVGKALRVTRYVEEQGTYVFDIERWTRTLEPDRLRVQEEQRRPRAGMHPGSPFVSLPPERLAAQGYVQGQAGAEEIRYYGPDARVLVDPSFQSTHCFALVTKAPEDGWVGLAFRPQDLRARDIEGTLWIDGDSYEPQRLEYRYPVLPWPLVTDKVGGRVDFTRLPEGPWIVSRWYIRMPVVGQQEFRLSSGARPQVRYSLAAVLEEGGEVRRAEAGAVAFASTLGRVEGAVVDSLTRDPVAGADVRIQGTFLADTTDASGRFSIEGVPGGRYLLVTNAPGLRDVGFEGHTVEVDVGQGTAAVEIGLPPAVAVVAERCAQPITEEGLGTLVGTVLAPDGTTFPGGTVHVTWNVVESGTAGTGRNRAGAVAPTVTVAQTEMTATVPVGSDGRFAICGAPEENSLVVRAEAPGFTGESTRLDALRTTLGHVELTLAAQAVSEALLVMVVEPNGRTPVESARVSLDALGRSAVTDASGTAIFPGVPVGPVGMTVTHMAYLSRTDTLDVGGEARTVVRVRLADHAVELEPLTVEVRTPEAIEARQRAATGSVSVSQPQIRELVRGARADNVADVIRATMPTGVKISPMVRGADYIGTCIESTRGNVQYRKIGGNVCAMVQVVLDGGYLTTDESARLVESFPLLDIVSVEFLSPMDQTFRYGTQNATGMLIIRTARGGGRD
jgi:hypothetical protein